MDTLTVIKQTGRHIHFCVNAPYDSSVLRKFLMKIFNSNIFFIELQLFRKFLNR